MGRVSRDPNRGGHPIKVLRDGCQKCAPQGHARPRQVGVPGGVDGGQSRERLHRAARCARIRDAFDGKTPQGVTAGVRGRGERPVGDDRSIGLQERHDEGVDVCCGLTARLENDDVGQARGIAHANLRVEACFALDGGRLDNDDDAARVLARNRIRHLDRVVNVDDVGNADEKGQDAAQRRGAAFVAQLDDARSDLRGCRVLQGNNHGSLQKRPSRANMSCADEGPHVPGA